MSFLQLQLRRDPAATWTAVDPILADGEIGLEKDTNKIKIGDGVTTWTSLDYFSGDIAIIDNLTTNDATQALSAAQGVVLDQKITQIRTDYGDYDADFVTPFTTALT